MAASKDKAQALKDSYVDGIIAELDGASDPAVRMTMRENDIASIHAFPESGKVGAINDGDPSFYIHGGEQGDSYKVDELPAYANPVPEGNGGRILMDGAEKEMNDTQNLLDQERRKMGGTGDLARLGPRTLEEFNKRNPSNRPRKERTLRGDRSSTGGFDASNLAGAMGMEQGNTAGAVFDLENGVFLGKNDGNPRMVIRDGNRRMVQAAGGARNPVRGGGYGAEDAHRLNPNDMAGLAAQLHGGGNNVDTTIYRKRKDIANQYNEQMYQSYTR